MPSHKTTRWKPRSIPTLIVMGVLRVTSFLPYRIQILIGSLIGRSLFVLAKRWRETAQTNIYAVFHRWDAQRRDQLVRQHFESIGIGLVEAAISWWAPDRKLRKLYEIEGLEHIQKALLHGKGVILLSAHFTTLEIGSRLLSLSQPHDAMFRKQNDVIFNHFMHHGRSSFLDNVIMKNDIRGLLKNLKNNHVINYAMDQRYSGKNSVFVDFFGIPAATNTAATRLAKASGAVLLPFHTHRKADKSGYALTISPPLDNIPGDNPTTDTQIIMKLFEQQITEAPEQYLWIHRRFKTQPDGHIHFYNQEAS